MAVNPIPQATPSITQDERAQRYRKRFQALESKRYNFEATWNDITRFILPTNEHFHHNRTPGTPKDPRVVDSTGRLNCQMLTSFVYTGVTNPSARWFELSLKFKKIRRLDKAGRTTILDLESNREVQDHLKECSDIIYKAFQSPLTRFETANYEVISSIVGLGTGCLYIGHEPGAPITFQAIGLHELFLAENAHGVVDTVFRKFTYTARQAAERWGLPALGEKLAKLASEAPEEEVQFLHAVHPSDDSGFYGQARAVHKFYSCYLCLTDNKILWEGGYKEMPYIVARWMKNINEVYGISQSQQALPDVRMLQRMHWTHVVMEEKMANPVTLLASNSDVQMNHSPGATVIGGLDSMGRPTVQNLPTGGDMNAALALEEQVRARIRAAFHTDKLAQADDPRSTATEARIRQMEQMRQLAPANIRLEQEYAGPLIMRTYQLLKAAGELPPEPEAMQGHDLIVEYLGPMSQAQKMVSAYTAAEFIQSIAPMMELNPAIVQNFDFDIAARSNASLYPLPPGFVRPKRQVEAERQAQLEAQQEAQQSAMMQQGLDQMQQVSEMGGLGEASAG